MLFLLAACSSPAPPPAPSPSPHPDPAEAPAPEAVDAPTPTAPSDLSARTGVYGLRGVDYSCAVCGAVTAFPGVDVRATASSELKGGKYGADNVIGTDLSSAWCEGTEGVGIGETLKLSFGREFVLDGIAVYGGFFKTEALLKANARIKRARVTSDDGTRVEIQLEDPALAKSTDPSTRMAIDDWFAHLTASEPPWVRLGDETKRATWVEVEILEVYPGEKYEDTCISHLAVMVVDPEDLD